MPTCGSVVHVSVFNQSPVSVPLLYVQSKAHFLAWCAGFFGRQSIVVLAESRANWISGKICTYGTSEEMKTSEDVVLPLLITANVMSISFILQDTEKFYR